MISPRRSAQKNLVNQSIGLLKSILKIENLKVRTLSVKIKGFQKFLANFRD